MVTELSIQKKPKCPEIWSTGGYSIELDDYIEGADVCGLTSKWCLLESGKVCDYYEDYLKEEGLCETGIT